MVRLTSEELGDIPVLFLIKDNRDDLFMLKGVPELPSVIRNNDFLGKGTYVRSMKIRLHVYLLYTN